jgi:ABC-2 type transport system ATP-binding protein
MSLQVHQLYVGYGDQDVLKGLDFQAPTATITGILGMNGSGKTTFFNTLFGQKKPFSGTIYWHEAPLQSRDVGFLETHPRFFPYTTGKEYLQLCAHQNPDFPMAQWNDLFRLPLDQFASTYSTGMKKKLAIMGIIALDCPLLLLDEPFNGLDLESVERLYPVLERLARQGKTILISSHILETLTRSCQRICRLQNGTFPAIYQQADFDTLATTLKDQFKQQTEDRLDELFGDQ